jgi:UDP:flavonoid glycosyltransferase YjiC (YdhE family)
LPIRGVLTTGRAVDPGDIPAPPNVQVLRAAPHRRVLAEASVVVTHAGHGIVMKALAAGVPMVCMPMGRDQKDNTARVLRLGAGIEISKRAKPIRIATAVAEVLGREQYAAGRPPILPHGDLRLLLPCPRLDYRHERLLLCESNSDSSRDRPGCGVDCLAFS